MARRRRYIPRRKSNRWLVAGQIFFLVALLVFILLFRDLIATSAGNVFDSFGSPDDVQVQREQTSSSDNAEATPKLSPDESGEQ